MDILCQQCGLVNDFTECQAGPHRSAYCNKCGNFIKHLKQSEIVFIYFGKYQGRELSSMKSSEELTYLNWLTLAPNLKKSLKAAIDKHLSWS